MDPHRAYAWPGPAAGRAVHVRVNFVASVDGAVDVGGRSRPLSSPADRSVFSALRDLCDVILVGAGTVRQEHYGPARPDGDSQARRLQQGLAPVPPIAVVTGGLGLDLASPFFVSAVARPLLLTATSAPEERRAAAALVADVVVAGEDRVEPEPALCALAQRGFTRVLCEGGPTLVAQLAAADRIDELCLSLSPQLAGPASSRPLASPPQAAASPVPLDLVHVLTDGSTLFLRYARASTSSPAGPG
ncbi:MAG: pyrimidine reductase family protein, partial [Acidimicrobiales bacterium]